MTRRRFLQTTALAAAGVGLPLFAHMRWQAPFDLRVRRERFPLPGLRAGSRPVRLAHLSDLHASGDVPDEFIERAFDLALAEKPDLACLTGDFVTNGVDFEPRRYARLMRRLSDRVHCYATMGNHDGGAWSGHFETSESIRNMLRDGGVEVLHNTSRVVEVPDAAGTNRFELVGLGDVWALEFAPEVAFGSITSGLPRLALSHNPDSKAALEHFDWNLLLSGHTHGGQIVLPWYGPIWVPVQDRNYLRGLKPWRDRYVHVTSGVGNVAGIRLNCPPEIVLMELHPQIGH